MTLMTRVFCAAGALLSSLRSGHHSSAPTVSDYNDGLVINVASIHQPRLLG